MANIYHFHLDYISKEYHQQIIDDPLILKILVTGSSKFRHGYNAPSMIFNGTDFHGIALDAAKKMPAVKDANAIIVRDDHPEFAWLILLVQQTPAS